jgi:microsomal dipeptidase-like Zn-dependent dipeptidase
METANLIVDIHTHPTLRAYNSRFPSGQRNIWEKTYNEEPSTPIGRWARMKSKEILKESQANLNCYASAKARVVFDALYPLEKGFLNYRGLPKLFLGRQKADEVLQAVTGYEAHQIKAMRKSNDYFGELMGQYAFLSKGQGASPCGQHQYRLANNWAEVQHILQADDHTIAVVVTIEGAHAFNCGLPHTRGYNGPVEQQILDNIGTTKAWRHAPFFVTFSHHFYNELCGHTRSLKASAKKVVSQREGIEDGFTPLGIRVAEALLSRDNGRRILIDVKHMSVKARKEYYALLDRYARAGDQVPIICSHTGMNEFDTMRNSHRRKDKPRKNRGSYFHNWAINLSAEEIRLISQSGGLIGVMVDKGLLGSEATVSAITSLQDAQARKDGFMELVASNLFQAVRAVGKPEAWDILALGSDYDGIISHMDAYPDAAHLPQLRTDLTDFIERRSYARELWYGKEPAELVGKVMSGNALAFMEKHF